MFPTLFQSDFKLGIEHFSLFAYYSICIYDIKGSGPILSSRAVEMIVNLLSRKEQSRREENTNTLYVLS